MNKTLRSLLVGAGVLSAGVVAMAQTAPASASDAFATAASASSGFGPSMFALAAATVGILIGVKWIKRAKGAA